MAAWAPGDDYDHATAIPLRDLLTEDYQRWTALRGNRSAHEEMALEALVYAGLYEVRHVGRLWLRDHRLRVDFVVERSGAWDPHDLDDLDILTQQILSKLPQAGSPDQMPNGSVILKIQPATSVRMTAEGERHRRDYEAAGAMARMHQYVRRHCTRETAVRRSLLINLKLICRERDLADAA